VRTIQRENLFFFVCPSESTFGEARGSASRTKNQIYLGFSEAQPTFDRR